MTSDPRWTEETEQLVAMFGPHADPDVASRRRCLSCRDWARLVLTALADAGLLVELGGRMDIEWGVQSPGYQVELRTASTAVSEAEARQWAADTPEVALVHRSVHTGPWRVIEPEPQS